MSKARPPTTTSTDGAEPGPATNPAPDQPVLAADRWANNAALIADCARLGYLRREWRVLDPTFGRGLWWTEFRPEDLVASDLATGVDFRCLPWPEAEFDAVAYDPPYVAPGGRRTTGLPDLFDRYGLVDAPATPALLQEMIDAGLAECARVVRPGGLLLVKCQDYVSSGRLWPGTHHTLCTAFGIGLELVDRLEHIGGVRPQPPNRRQVHARRNLSTLLVLRRR
jgi:hypothetical protein